MKNKTVIITGAARRIGACIAQTLHQAGANVVVHYRGSEAEAKKLTTELNKIRAESAATIKGDLADEMVCNKIIDFAVNHYGRLDALINNASSFFPTPLGKITEQHWQDLMASNLKAPLFLAQRAQPFLRVRNGAIINITDIHARIPMQDHLVYSIAKAGLDMLTRGLALELGPEIRVNGVAPGPILWPEEGFDQRDRESIIEQTTLKRTGEAQDIADTVLFLLSKAPYISGQTIAVDGGRSVSGSLR